MKPEPLKKKFDLINLGYDIAQDSEKTMLKERVDWLLKEIEKRIREADSEETSCINENEQLEAEWWNGYQQALEDVKDLIKKAFSGVIEDE